MNHEKLMNDATEGSTRWDDLGEEAQFASDFTDAIDALESNEVLKNRLVETYQDKVLDLVISLYDGSPWSRDGRRNPDDYTESMAVDEIIGENLQWKMIEEFCRTGYIDGVKQEVVEKIAETFASSSHSARLAEDPFLRYFHIEQLAGRLGPQPEQSVLDVAFSLDSDFNSLPEVGKLLSDPDYIHKTYGQNIEYMSQRQGSNEKDTNGVTRDEINLDVERKLSELIRQTLDAKDSSLSQEELLYDPFLRDQRCDEYAYGESSCEDRRPLIDVLWALDEKSFFDSTELRDYLAKVCEDNAVIFDDVDPVEIESKIAEVLDRIPDREIVRIVDRYAQDPKDGDKELVCVLAQVLGLRGEEPALVYEDKSKAGDNESASYSIPKNTITYFEHADYPWFQRFLQKITMSSYPPPYRRMRAIAHEMWHAHQCRGDNLSEEEQTKYSLNDRLYVSPRMGYDIYRSQVVEREAFAFDAAFGARVTELKTIA